MLKLWKGLFFCFWHSDKAPVQMELAERLAAVMQKLSAEVAYLYFSCFITTMRREWFSLDRQRLDKFLMLTRKIVNHMLRHLASQTWQSGLVQKYMDFLKAGLLLPDGPPDAAGLAYHLCA
ncbi:uncharacterized protein HaLaN_25164, partial [Haematococcus lacustris]